MLSKTTSSNLFHQAVFSKGGKYEQFAVSNVGETWKTRLDNLIMKDLRFYLYCIIPPLEVKRILKQGDDTINTVFRKTALEAIHE